MSTTPYANSLFEQPWWLDIVAPGKWAEAAVKEGEEIVARMPYVLEKGKIVMPPLTQTLGPWMKPEYRAFHPGNTQLSKQKELISQLMEQLPKHKGFNMCLDSANEYILPYRWMGFRYEPSFSYRIQDLTNLDLVYQNFNKTAKKNIRRSQKELVVRKESDAGLLYDMMEKTFQHQNRHYPLPRELIMKIVETCDQLQCGKMFAAYDKDGNVHAASYLVYDERCAYALLGGADPAFRNSGGKSLVWWEEIQYAATVSKMFDFEGSNIESIENFVRQFGGERVTNYIVSNQSLASDFVDMVKPRIKKMIGYKI